MRHPWIFLLVCGTSFAINAPPIPESFTSRNHYRSAPAWVSARTALDESGKLRPKAVPDGEHTRLTVMADDARRRAASAASVEKATGDCDVIFGNPMDEAPDMGASLSWDEIAKRAERGQYYGGTVVGTEVGLYSGIPFTVLQVRVEKSTAQSAPSYVYVLYPNGSMIIQSTRYCTKPFGYAASAAKGDRLFFVARETVDDDGVLFRVAPDRLFVQHGSDLLAPPRLKRDPVVASARDIRDLEDRLPSGGRKPERF